MRRKQFEKLLIYDFTENAFHLPPHKHTYYELAYIHKGCGINFTNSVAMNYSAGDIFLLAPDDLHFMEIKKISHITMIKFTDAYFAGFQKNSMERPEDIMLNASFKEKKIKFNSREKKILKNSIDNILLSNESNDIENSAFVYYQIIAIFGLIRDHSGDYANAVTEPDRITQVTHYIHNHIYSPKRLRIAEIAAHFHLAEKYFGTFFKRNTGISYQNYINRYKLGLIENRLRQSIMNKAEIAAEFGFTDTSHLLHFLKKNTDNPLLNIPNSGNSK